MALINDPELLAAALNGYQQQLNEIEAKMAELKRRLGGRVTATLASPATKRSSPGASKSRLSEEARARIAAAQRKRWAAVKRAAKK